MTTMTMPTTIDRPQPKRTSGGSHLLPFLLAMACLVATGVIAILISGPTH